MRNLSEAVQALLEENFDALIRQGAAQSATQRIGRADGLEFLSEPSFAAPGARRLTGIGSHA